ncbi:MAG TPA: hypothetical protein VKX39_10840 [Bryobacteraceae bacterium]|jgi:hypothetical protein|nr:hypothetical protein [Bryobacteraceae bacterium]
MLRLLPFLLPVLVFTAPAAEFKGVLLDKDCSSKAEEIISTGSPDGPSIEGGMLAAEAHTRECLRAPQCEKSGYGIYTNDLKFFPFDAAGNRKAVEALKLSKRETDIRVEVTGEVDNGVLKVATLKLL